MNVECEGGQEGGNQRQATADSERYPGIVSDIRDSCHREETGRSCERGWKEDARERVEALQLVLIRPIV